MLRDVANPSSQRRTLGAVDGERGGKPQGVRRGGGFRSACATLVRCAGFGVLLLLLLYLCTALFVLVSASGVDDAAPIPSLVETPMYATVPLTAHDNVAHRRATSSTEVALQYTFGGGNVVLVLSQSGLLHAYHLESGHLAWSADIGGDMIAVDVDLPPSQETIAKDPLALPFLVRGNSLFTRTPFYTYDPASPSSTLDTADLLSNLPDVLRPYFFMNISTLLRRQTVFFGGTDILVTTSVEVADLDSSTGHHLTLQRRGRGRGKESTAAHTARRGASAKLYNALQPILHLVRYNIVLHVMKAGEYSWSITLSQLQLSPRTNLGTSPTAVEKREHNGEGNPRFFSHLMRDLFDYDTTHADAEGRHTSLSTREECQQKDARRAASMGVGETEEGRAEAAALFTALERRRTELAKYVSHALSMEQYNTSHIRLHNLLDDTVTWAATLPPSPSACRSAAANAEDAEEEVTAAPPRSFASSEAVAAYVWVSGAEQVFRIPVQHLINGGALGGGEEEEKHGTQPRHTVARTHADEAARALGLSPSSFTAGVVSTAPRVVGDLSLVPFLRPRDRTYLSYAAIAMDVEGDEREGAELDHYYHERSWWESHLSSPPSALPSSADSPIHSFSTAGDVVSTGLAWRTAGIISFHVLCLAGSIAFLCAGVPPRNQLQRAWAQADRKRDRLSHTSTSRPHSTQLVPQDLMSTDGSAGSPFSPVRDGFSVDGPAQLAKAGGRLGGSDGGGMNTLHTWLDPTPEEVYAMLREESEEQASLHLTTTASATASASQPSCSLGKEGVLHSTGGAGGAPAACARAGVASVPAQLSCSSDDESEEIDMGERWWVRAQHRPQLPSVVTLDEVVSEGASSVRFSPVHDNASTEEEGKLFQLHFKVLEKVGFGGEGCVFCVEHRVTHARYAIKAILIHEQDEERVVQEAVLHSSFDNANVVRFYFCWIEDIAVSTADRLQLCNVGEDGMDTLSMGFSSRSMTASSPAEDTLTDDDHEEAYASNTCHMLFIQMEYFSRGTLADWLRTRKGFYRLEVLRYMQNIADGLAYLHNQDVVHRDLKPTNIFVSNTNVLKIGDFGLAKRRVATGSSTGDLASNVAGGQQERSVVGGSPLYCSPEQMRGDPVNKPSDIFSLGIIAVEMLCTFATLHERIRVLTDAHQGVLPAELERDFPEEAHIIKPLLACEPQQRPPLRKVQRQLLRLIDTLEESEPEAEDLPHSPAEMVEPSHRSSEIRHPCTPEAGMSSPKPTSDVPEVLVEGHGVGVESPSPLRRSSTASSVTLSARRVSAEVGSAAAHAAAAAAAGASSSTLSAPSLHALSSPSASTTQPTTAFKLDAGLLPEWQAASGGGALPSTSQKHPPFRPSMSSVHPVSAGRQRNSYHNRRYTSSGSSPDAHAGASSMSRPETAPSAEGIVAEPCGPPATPVTYTGDADLSTILKQDMQDRAISAPD